MKSILTLLLFIVFILPEGFTQDSLVNKTPSPVKIRMHCGLSLSDTQPLYIIDGKIAESLSPLKPDDIESITVLKNSAATALYGSRAFNGCIIVTTKKAKFQIVVKDGNTGSPLPNVTCRVRYGNKSVTLLTDENGIVDLRELKFSGPYSIALSSIGYIPSHTTLDQKNNTAKEIFLDRDILLSEEVVVSTSCVLRKKRIVYTCRATDCQLEINREDKKMEPTVKDTRSSFRVYPNPVAKGNLVSIELPNEFSEGNVIVSDAMGNRVYTESIKNGEETNRSLLQTRAGWAAGIYFVSLVSPVGKKWNAMKLIIQ